MTEPRVIALCGKDSQELPGEWLHTRFAGETDLSRAFEIAPGVKVALMYTGDVGLPDGSFTRGARIAVWGESESG